MIILNRILLRLSLTVASGVGVSHGDNFASAFSIKEKFSVEVVIPFQISPPVDMATLFHSNFVSLESMMRSIIMHYFLPLQINFKDTEILNIT
jgi:hypothetical protein